MALRVGRDLIEAHGKIPKSGRSLLIEHSPRLQPADYRRILTTGAKRVGTTPDFGSGPVAPLAAIQAAVPEHN